MSPCKLCPQAYVATGSGTQGSFPYVVPRREKTALDSQVGNSFPKDVIFLLSAFKHEGAKPGAWLLCVPFIQQTLCGPRPGSGVPRQQDLVLALRSPLSLDLTQ